MAELDGTDFGADSDAIRRWLAKRATYADPAHGGKHRVDPPGTVDPKDLSVPSSRDAGRHVLDALVAPEPPIATKWPTPYQRVRTEPDAAAPADAATKVHPTPPPRTGTTPGTGSPYASTPEHEEELISSRSANAVFEPRTGARRTVTALFVIVCMLLAVAGYQAYQDRTTVTYGLAALLGVLALVVWGVRASTSVTEMAVIRGQLEMIRNGKFELIDLASPYTPVLVAGTPGQRGWQVLIERHDQPLLKIDRSMVDPRLFTTVLYRVRPDLRQETPASAP